MIIDFTINMLIIQQIIFQLIAGYQTNSSADVLSKDPIFQSLLAKEQLASQPSISRLWNRLSQENISQLQEVNQILIIKTRAIAESVVKFGYERNDFQSGFYP